jgi:hypothetical protein
MGAPIRVLVADDSLALREGIRDMLELFDDIELVGAARDTGEAVALARASKPPARTSPATPRSPPARPGRFAASPHRGRPTQTPAPHESP